MSQGLYERTTGQRQKRRRRRALRPVVLILLVTLIAITACLVVRSCEGGSPAMPPETTPMPEAVVPTTEATEPVTEVPTVEPTEELTEEPTEAPTEEPTEAPTEEPTEAPTEEPTEAPTEEPTEELTEEPTEEVTTAPTEPDVPKSQKIVNKAKEQIGKPYAYGGTGPDTFDTSGLVYYCCKKAGISLPRTTDKQAKKGTEVAEKDLQPGDVVFFWTSNPGTAEYQGIYIGDGKFIAARNPEKPVSELDMNWDYFKERYLFARRYW